MSTASAPSASPRAVRIALPPYCMTCDMRHLGDHELDELLREADVRSVPFGGTNINLSTRIPVTVTSHCPSCARNLWLLLPNNVVQLACGACLHMFSSVATGLVSRGGKTPHNNHWCPIPHLLSKLPGNEHTFKRRQVWVSLTLCEELLDKVIEVLSAVQ